MCLVELVILYLKTYPRTGAQTVHRMINVQRFTWSMTKMSTQIDKNILFAKTIAIVVVVDMKINNSMTS